MHSQRVGVPQGSLSGKWLSAKRRKWIPFKPALTGKARLTTTTTTWATLKRLYYLKSERSRARRYSFVASIELTDVQSETRFTEQTSNLSLFGCHVHSGKLLPAGTRIRVKIVRMGASFVALGKVVYALSTASIGVVFTEIDPNHQFILEKWIAQLRNSKGRAPKRAARF